MKKLIPTMLRINKGHKQQQQQRPWQWQWRPSSCHHHPDTLSFRDHDPANIIFKTHNSIFLHHHHHHHQDDLSVPDSYFSTSSSSSSSYSDIIDHNHYSYNSIHIPHDDIIVPSSSEEEDETIIRCAVKSSDRLFFEPEPGRSTSSILLPKEEAEAQVEVEVEEEEKEDLPAALPFKESVALALESEDPYQDFKESMREMVESQGLKNKMQEQDWESLEELLGWYLRMNKRMNHGIIVGAFVDLLLGLAVADNNNSNNIKIKRKPSSSSVSSYSSADSCFSSPRSVVVREGEEGEADDEDS